MTKTTAPLSPKETLAILIQETHGLEQLLKERCIWRGLYAHKREKLVKNSFKSVLLLRLL